MQLVNHVVVATYKWSISPGRLQDREFEGSYQEPPTVPIIFKMNITPTVNCIANEPPGTW